APGRVGGELGGQGAGVGTESGQPRRERRVGGGRREARGVEGRRGVAVARQERPGPQAVELVGAGRGGGLPARARLGLLALARERLAAPEENGGPRVQALTERAAAD